MTYRFSLESIRNTYAEIEPLYRSHYEEMATRLADKGVLIGEYKPRLTQYFAAGDDGWLLTFIVREEDSSPVGYCNVYLTNDMHNGDLIAQEDTLYVVKDHRNGVGKELVKFALEELRKRGVKRVLVSASTDLRVAKLWGRMGFKEVATQMAYTF